MRRAYARESVVLDLLPRGVLSDVMLWFVCVGPAAGTLMAETCRCAAVAISCQYACESVVCRICCPAVCRLTSCCHAVALSVWVLAAGTTPTMAETELTRQTCSSQAAVLVALVHAIYSRGSS